MNKQPHVGLSLINKAPIGLVLTAIIALLANILLPLNLATFAYAVVGGGLCAALLIRYWLGKGGIYFVLGLTAPLVLVLITPLASFAALINLLSGFFFGFCLLLMIYKYTVFKVQ